MAQSMSFLLTFYKHRVNSPRIIDKRELPHGRCTISCRTTISGTMTIDCTSESILSIYLSIDGDRIDDIRITMPFYYQSFIRPLGGSFETPSALPRQHSSCPSIYILCRADKDNIAAFRAMADRARICGCSASLVHDVTRNP